MLIDLNTDELQAAANAANQTNNMLLEAMNLLNQVVVHNDWACPERHAINDNTVQNRTMVSKMQADAQNFYQTIQQVTELFLEAEQQINQSFGQVEGSLASFLSLVPGNISIAGNHGDFSAQVESLVGSLGDSALDNLNVMKRGADICSFEDIAAAFQKK